MGGIALTFQFNPGEFSLTDVTVTNFDSANYTSFSSGGGPFTTNAYSSVGAGLSITSGTRDLRLNGAFFAGQAAPSAPLATGGQGYVTDTNYQARFTYAAQRP